MNGAPYVHSFVNFKLSLFVNLLRLILSYNIVCVCVSLKFISTAVHNVILIENIKDLSNFVSFSWLPPLGAGWYGAGWDTVSRCPNTVSRCPTSVSSCAQFYPTPILSQTGQKMPFPTWPILSQAAPTLYHPTPILSLLAPKLSQTTLVLYQTTTTSFHFTQ